MGTCKRMPTNKVNVLVENQPGQPMPPVGAEVKKRPIWTNWSAPIPDIQPVLCILTVQEMKLLGVARMQDLFLPIVLLQAFAVASGVVGCNESLICNCIAGDFAARGPYVIGFSFFLFCWNTCLLKTDSLGSHSRSLLRRLRPPTKTSPTGSGLIRGHYTCGL
mgnify:CR=1 FL=1